MRRRRGRGKLWGLSLKGRGKGYISFSPSLFLALVLQFGRLCWLCVCCVYGVGVVFFFFFFPSSSTGSSLGSVLVWFLMVGLLG